MTAAHQVLVGTYFGLLTLLLGCGPADETTSSDALPDAGLFPDGSAGAATGTTNEALVFANDPQATPEPITVELSSVSDDEAGALISAADSTGVRRLSAVSCVDEGQTDLIPGYAEQRICTLRHLANKQTNGSFVYDDYAADVACSYAPENRNAEVNLYYHVERIYDLVTAAEVGVFDLLPGRHEVNGQPVPLTVVSSYRQPAPVNAGGLAPVDVAFFASHEHLDMGMARLYGLDGVPGDVLVFGQGVTTDFAYAADTVYHEFGHAVVNATAALGFDFADSQGLTNQPTALNEGIANTMAFLGTEQAHLGGFLEACSGPGWGFDADNTARFPDDLIGHPVVDGNPILGANYALFRALVDDWGAPRAAFTRVLLLALQDLAPLGGNATFAHYSEALLDRLDGEGLTEHRAQAAALLDAHGVRSEARGVDLTGASADDQRILFMGCAAEYPWNSWLDIDLGSGVVPMSTAYVQHRVTVPQGATELHISARLAVSPMAMTDPGDWDYRLLVRRAGPITYSYDEDEIATGNQDEALVADITPGEGGAAALATWTLTGLASGQTVYLHFVNLGSSEGVLAGLTVE